ncbi:peroxisomal biogenesis factor 5 [Nomia melanderi]|uniref:peroxisomal biogenesis factor 5 n=1 Tax=Nomia melanderi TaxID=2448451 RepID=UPI00130460AA|nr:peroxisomal targeting signal 1 receptor [Nomia melanderi]XP_031844429.1 peroxisomal targeting signal 1 receptor [Nomia melanderi]XP_031844430.1 peroxisomal targeting signal 1 receptor [Nomia melanderi]XP_031844431.1 peroxisomal targeting signal 1 receptor [Nomia melanderi]XP_031844432.1 peroxisomal targeting signal 1 receptor [Nomia melanderi]XP_031844433.1 peroxisomal targeting signal 1 receptor [Nomia melanderi]XP_031844434.1 peroxisomal targeting signal 1 receptor [Nomia melanderi]XP_0
MAFRELVEGDCGGPSSLIHLTSHFVHDHGFKEEGIHPPFGHIEPYQPIDSDQLVKQFLEENASCPQTFRMDNLLQEMREIDHNIHPPIAAPGVAQELTGLDTAWANQYLQSGRHFSENHTDDIWHPNIQQHSNVVTQQTHELGLGPKWAEEYIEHSIDAIQTDINEKNTTETIENDHGKVAYSKFMKFMKQEGEEELAVAGNWIDEFEKDNASSEVDSTDPAFLRLQNEWEKISSQEVSTKHPWLSEYETYYDPFKEYEFHEENPMKDVPNPLEEGKKRLEAGDLPSAILCFEAAVKQNENDPEAWLLLGKTQAENEQDPLAIPALKRCLTIDPMNGAALMALAVSYTNESYQNQACLTLKEWLLKNEKYKHLTTKKSNVENDSRYNVSSILFDDVHEDVKNLYIQAARINPRNEIDADVQCGLGVLFNLSNEYDKACDCFQAALQVRPDDSRLWNRLGATLANGQKSEEAINAYHCALKLSPGFIRARYNLGISCIKLGAYKEAGEHLLTALNQQAAGRGTQGENFSPKAMSNTIWSTLRLVLSLMYKYHLIDAIESRDLARLNKEFEIV